MSSMFSSLAANRTIRLFLVAGFLAGSIGVPARVHAQAAPNGGPDFDPVTRTFSSRNPSVPDPNAPATAAPAITPEQQAQIDEQKRQAQIQQMREEAKKKADAARKAQKDKEDAARKVEMDRALAMKQRRDERLAQMKENQKQLKLLLQEEKDARVSYQKAKQSATGSTSQIDDDYRKAEKDRQDKIRALRHPKFKSDNDKNAAPGTSTSLPGTTTSGTGPTATTH